jgi:uncharacterized protein
MNDNESRFAMSMNTLVEAEIWTVARTDQGNAVMIRPLASEVAVPIFIGPLETQAILIGLGGVGVPRPLTHDLIIALVKRLGATVARAEIVDLKEGTYYARLILLREGVELDFDLRPSDALAIVTRTNCPLFIAEQVVDEAGLSIQDIQDKVVPERGSAFWPVIGDFRDFLSGLEAQVFGSDSGRGSSAEDDSENGESLKERLEADLEKAVAEENYEEAARIRDRLRKLDEGA